MGYTHYWMLGSIPRGQAARAERLYQWAVAHCQKLVYKYSKANGGISGYTAHCKPGVYGGLIFNGSERSGMCETFVMRKHFRQNDKFNFCKTNHHEYDVLVKACLVIMKHYLGDLIEVRSDGDGPEWIGAIELAQTIFPNQLRNPLR